MEDNTSNPTTTAAEPAPETSTDLAQAQRQRDEYYDLLLRKRPNSTTTASAWSAIARSSPKQRQRASSKNCCRSWTISSGRSRRKRPATPQTRTASGVELIHKQLGEILRKRGVRPIEALGADFDPYFHQAVSYEPAEGRREGEVIEEFRRGYMLGDRLLRPSMVKVAKG